MTDSRVLLILVVTAMVLTMAQARVGNCTVPLTTPTVLASPNGQTSLSSFGTFGLIQSASNGRVYPESFTVKLDFLGIAERNKTYAGRTCSTPNGLGSDPYSPTQGNGLAAPILYFHNASEFDCYPFKDTKYINGTEIIGLYIRYTREDMPDANLLFSYEFSDSDVDIFVTNDTTYTNGTPYTFHWPANRLKITTMMENFPWSQPPSSSNTTTQFVSAHFQVSMTLLAGGNGFFEDSIRSTRMRYNTTDQWMEFEFEKAYFVDGVAYDNDQSYAHDPIPIGGIDNDIPLTSHIGIGICHDHFGQWKKAIYDPQLSSVFFAPSYPC